MEGIGKVKNNIFPIFIGFLLTCNFFIVMVSLTYPILIALIRILSVKNRFIGKNFDFFRVGFGAPFRSLFLYILLGLKKSKTLSEATPQLFSISRRSGFDETKRATAPPPCVYSPEEASSYFA